MPVRHPLAISRSLPRLISAGDMAYHWFNEFVSELFILGFHRLVSSPPDGPFFVLETRKRIFAMAVAQDKSISTLLGRPPRIDSRFCDLTLPFDLDDDEVVLDGSRLETALNGLDADGWKCNQGTEAGQTLRPAVLIRLRYRHALLQERVLGLWMTERQESFSETLQCVYFHYHIHTYQTNKPQRGIRRVRTGQDTHSTPVPI